jgi:hypothetical protein
MSTPVRGPAGPLSYAPRWARSPTSIGAGADRESTAEPDAMPVRGETAEPPWRRKKSPAMFEGDVAIKELRERLALAPDQIPEPAPVRPGGALIGVVARLVGVMVLAAGGALGFLWLTAPREASPERQIAMAGDVADRFTGEMPGRPGGQAGIISIHKPVAMEQQAVSTETLKADRAPLAPAVFTQVAEAPRGRTEGAGATPAPRVTLPATETRIAPLAGAAPAAAAAAPDQEVTALLARGRAYIAEGDVAAARLVLRRAVERGDSQAALALGGTFDPIVLKRLGVISFVADPEQARDWYRKAAELGSVDAPARIEQLAQAGR